HPGLRQRSAADGRGVRRAGGPHGRQFPAGLQPSRADRGGRRPHRRATAMTARETPSATATPPALTLPPAVSAPASSALSTPSRPPRTRSPPRPPPSPPPPSRP